MDRRDFLRASAALATFATLPAAGLLIPRVANAAVDTSDFWTRDRVLWVRRSGTRNRPAEQFRVVFWTAAAGIDIPNYIRLCYLLRDVEEDQSVMMDVNLLNLMYGLQYWNDLEVGRPVPYIATSGQRMPRTNARTEGAAWDSLHQAGRAMDGGILGMAPRTLAERAEFFGFGGVGVYDTHTHIDTGRKRKWDATHQGRASGRDHLLRLPSIAR